MRNNDLLREIDNFLQESAATLLEQSYARNRRAVDSMAMAPAVSSSVRPFNVPEDVHQKFTKMSPAQRWAIAGLVPLMPSAAERRLTDGQRLMWRKTYDEALDIRMFIHDKVWTDTTCDVSCECYQEDDNIPRMDMVVRVHDPEYCRCWLDSGDTCYDMLTGFLGENSALKAMREQSQWSELKSLAETDAERRQQTGGFR